MNPAPFSSELFDRPVIILAAPRFGSTLLFETLAEAPAVWTVGGESHQFIEGIRSLNPQSGMVDSNRLDEGHAEEHVVKRLRQRFARMLRDRDGVPVSQSQPQSVRFLEKTPKNALEGRPLGDLSAFARLARAAVVLVIAAGLAGLERQTVAGDLRVPVGNGQPGHPGRPCAFAPGALDGLFLR